MRLPSRRPISPRQYTRLARRLQAVSRVDPRYWRALARFIMTFTDDCVSNGGRR